MKSAAVIALAATLMLPVTSAVADMAHTMVGDLRLEQPWTRATPGGAPAGGGYLTITNTGSEDDRLVAASTDRVKVTEIHSMDVVDGVMKMRKLEDGLELPAGETVQLAPGGFHLMFMGLAEPIGVGETFAVELTFEKAGTVVLEMTAAPLGASEPHAGHGGHGN